MLILLCIFIIGEKYNVETKTIVANFEDRVTIYSKIKAELEGLEIGILGLYHNLF